MSKRLSKKVVPTKLQGAPAVTQRYWAGCGRHWDIASTESDLAYTALEFPECPTCPHRVDPEGVGAGASSFCTLRPKGEHPFAALAGWLD